MPSALSLALAASLVAAPLAVHSDGGHRAGHAHGRHARGAHVAAAARPSKARHAPGPPDATILGDSYTAGANASSPRRGYAERIAHDMNWAHAEIHGLAGAGYVKPSVTGRWLRAVVRRAVRRQPPIVIIVMGHNDTRVDPVREERAAQWTLGILRRRLPHSRIVVVGPIWQSGDPEPRVFATRDAILSAVRAIGGLHWIDPLAEHWFTGDRLRHTGNASRLISSDDNHPNDAGHEHIARLLLHDLRRMGIDPLP